jgi:PAS domain-containing protein
VSNELRRRAVNPGLSAEAVSGLQRGYRGKAMFDILQRIRYLGTQFDAPPNSPGADSTLEKFPKDQKHLEQILDYLPDGIICHDRERRIICFNRAAEALTGYAR